MNVLDVVENYRALENIAEAIYNNIPRGNDVEDIETFCKDLGFDVENKREAFGIMELCDANAQGLLAPLVEELKMTLEKRDACKVEVGNVSDDADLYMELQEYNDLIDVLQREMVGHIS